MKCLNCGTKINFSSKKIGQIVKCPKCGQKIQMKEHNHEVSSTIKEIKKIKSPLSKKIAKEIEKNLTFT